MKLVNNFLYTFSEDNNNIDILNINAVVNVKYWKSRFKKEYDEVLKIKRSQIYNYSYSYSFYFGSSYIMIYEKYNMYYIKITVCLNDKYYHLMFICKDEYIINLSELICSDTLSASKRNFAVYLLLYLLQFKSEIFLFRNGYGSILLETRNKEVIDLW